MLTGNRIKMYNSEVREANLPSAPENEPKSICFQMLSPGTTLQMSATGVGVCGIMVLSCENMIFSTCELVFTSLLRSSAFVRSRPII